MKASIKRLASGIAIILVAATSIVAITSCGGHTHTFAEDWATDDKNHWHGASCDHGEETSDLDAHAYDNACDAECNVCGYKRASNAHTYDNACDTSCNTCNATRTINHAYGSALTADANTHSYICSVCGNKKDEAAHTFDKTVVSADYLKAAATATTKAQYYKTCVCGKASATEFFEIDKTAATITNIQDLSKIYDKVVLADPTYDTNSDGAVTIEWYQGNTKLDSKPVNAGDYKVKISIAETATYTAVSAEKEFTITKKALNYLELSMEYNGSYGFFEYPLGTEHGVVEGDTVLFSTDDSIDYYVGVYKLIDYNDPTTIDDDGADDRATLSGADAANYKFAEHTEGKYKLCATVTVTKREIEIYHEFTLITGKTEYEYTLDADDGVVGDDTVVLKVVFEAAQVNAGIASKILYENGAEAQNYALSDATTINLIIPVPGH